MNNKAHVLIAAKDVIFKYILRFSNKTSTVPHEINLTRMNSLYRVYKISLANKATYGYKMRITWVLNMRSSEIKSKLNNVLLTFNKLDL